MNFCTSAMRLLLLEVVTMAVAVNCVHCEKRERERKVSEKR